MNVPLSFDNQSTARIEREETTGSFTISDIVEQISGFVRRQYPIFVFVIACSTVLGLVYLLTTPPSYTSHAMLLIDSSKMRVLQQQQTPVADVPIDAAYVETQVEILKSENIGVSVVKDLRLTDEPEFTGSGSGFVGAILGYLKSQQSETGLERKALAAFLQKRSIARVGRTYVLDIGFSSLSAGRAARIANAIADAYIVDQLEAKYQATKRAGTWLQERIKELRRQASDADRAVLDYKEKNSIVDVGRTPSGDPRLLAEQQLEDLNTQVGAARAAAEEAKARLARIDEIMKKDLPDATVTDTLHSEVVTRLRNSYLDIAAKEAIWSARYGASHLAAVNLRSQMAELRRAILDELGRTAQSYKSDYEIAKSRVDGLERNLASLVANSQMVKRDRLGLADLESTAKVYHTIYDNFLQRYMEAIQQQSFPITEARVISPAAPSQHKSGPLTIRVLGLAAVIGILLSFGIAVLREAVDRVFRTARQIETTLQVSCLAVLPNLSGTSKWPNRKDSKRSRPNDGIVPTARASIIDNASAIGHEPPAASLGQEMNPLLKVSPLVQFEQNRSDLGRGNSAREPEIAVARRLISSKRELMHRVVDEPLSAFAEAFRSIKIAADINGSRKINKVIGITSTLPNEGKSTVSSNLAELIAHSGKRVILVDGDLRNPSLTRCLASDANAGLLEVLNNTLTLNDAIYFDERTGLSFIPTVSSSRLVHTNEVLSSDSFKCLIDNLRKLYDYVIVDLSPIAPVVDVRATTGIIDSYIYVIEWGRTMVNLVQHQLESAAEVRERLLGVVLNKADIRVLERYESYYGKSYYRKHYGGQYPYSAQNS